MFGSCHSAIACQGQLHGDDGAVASCIQHATVSQCGAVAVMKREAQETAKSLQTLHDWAVA